MHPNGTILIKLELKTLVDPVRKTPYESDYFWDNIRKVAMRYSRDVGVLDTPVIDFLESTPEELEERINSRLGMHLTDIFRITNQRNLSSYLESVYGVRQSAVTSQLNKSPDRTWQFLLASEEYQDWKAKEQLLGKIKFKVKIVGYGSVVLSLFVEGVAELAKFYSGHHEEFISFLNVYVPEAFDASLETSGILSQKLSTEVTPTQQFNEQFKNMNKPVESPIKHSNSTNFLWKLANYSLLVPVVFMLLILTLAFENVTETSKEQREMQRHIYTAQKDLIELQLKMIKTYKIDDTTDVSLNIQRSR